MASEVKKIFLANERGAVETNSLKRYSSFSVNNIPFADFSLCDDEYLEGGKISFFLARTDSYQIFLPLNGRIDIVHGNKEYRINSNQVQVLNVGKGEVLEISNPDIKEVNYLQFGINTDLFLLKSPEMLFNLEVEKKSGEILPIINHSKIGIRLNAGLFTASEELMYELGSITPLFIYLVNGCFEIDGVQLNQRDGLAFLDKTEINIKSLSENASLLTLTIKPLF